MRWKCITAPVLFAGLVTLATVDSQGQPPGGFGGRGERGDRGPGGFGRGNFDPGAMWDRMAQGQDSINLNDPRFGFMKGMMERRGEPLPPNGILTKQQFITSAQQRMAQRSAEGGAPGRFTPPGSSPSPMTFTATPGADGKPVIMMQGGPPGMGGMPGMSGNPAEMTQNFFRMSDRNGDGKITRDEATRGLRDRFDQYDTNRDGVIDANEYQPYIQERMAGRGQGGPGGSFDPRSNSMSSSIPNNGPGGWNGQGNWNNQGGNRDNRDNRNAKEEDERPTVIRYGKLPKGLPSWWDELDTDQDGQIGLYEWRRNGKQTSEFVELDLNGDGYLTADEWLRHEQLVLDRRPHDSDSGSVGFGGGSGNGFGGRGSGGPGGNMRFQPGNGGNDRGKDRPNGGNNGADRPRKERGNKDRSNNNEDRPRKGGKNPFTGN